jgi:hypothetical protein
MTAQLQPDHEGLSKAVVKALGTVKRMPKLRVAGRADLRKAVLLTGRDLLQACELLENEFDILILPQEVAQIALDGPTVDRVVETIRRELDYRLLGERMAAVRERQCDA